MVLYAWTYLFPSCWTRQRSIILPLSVLAYSLATYAVLNPYINRTKTLQSSVLFIVPITTVLKMWLFLSFPSLPLQTRLALILVHNATRLPWSLLASYGSVNELWPVCVQVMGALLLPCTSLAVEWCQPKPQAHLPSPDSPAPAHGSRYEPTFHPVDPAQFNIPRASKVRMC